MIKDRIYESFNSAYKNYNLEIKKKNLPFKAQSKFKLMIRCFLDLIFKLIPKKLLEKLFKIYF